MAITIDKGVKQLVAEANAEITIIPIDEAIQRHADGDDSLVFIDIRDIRELEREGMVPGASHVPRGMIEFWFDPDSPYYKEWLGDEAKTYVLYCASAWRSALSCKTLKDMGFPNAAHFEGGFGAWKENGAPIAEKEKR